MILTGPLYRKNSLELIELSSINKVSFLCCNDIGLLLFYLQSLDSLFFSIILSQNSGTTKRWNLPCILRKQPEWQRIRPAMRLLL